jgi:hypothetical protein
MCCSFRLLAHARLHCMVAHLLVCTLNSSNSLLCYTSGAFVRSMGSNSAVHDQAISVATVDGGMRLTLDGQFIVASEYGNKRLSMFHVCRGCS